MYYNQDEYPRRTLAKSDIPTISEFNTSVWSNGRIVHWLDTAVVFSYPPPR